MPDLGSMVDDRAIANLLVTGLDDWVLFDDVIYEARHTSPAEDPYTTALSLVAEMLEQGLVEVGEVSREPVGFVAWDIPDHEVLARIQASLDALAGAPLPFALCWLANTDEGDRRARAILDA
jgi:hypothetical protein